MVAWLAILWITVASVLPINTDPCDPQNHKVRSGEWRRSVNYTKASGEAAICDRYIDDGWYRFDSPAGNDISTSCVLPNHCGTTWPIWMKGNLPTRNQEINAKACVYNFFVSENKCCDRTYDIKVKNCNDEFNVYYLVGTDGCSQAYCVGTEVPCPGLPRGTRFTPDCDSISSSSSSVITADSSSDLQETSPIISTSSTFISQHTTLFSSTSRSATISPTASASHPTTSPTAFTSQPITSPITSTPHPITSPTTSTSYPTTSPTTSTSRPTTLPTTSITDPTTIPTTSITDPTTLLTTSITDPTTIPSASITDPTTIPTTSITDPTTLPSTSITDPTTIPTTSITDPTTIPSTSITDPTTIPSTSITDPTTIPTTSITDPTTIPTTSKPSPTTSPTTTHSTTSTTTSTSLPTTLLATSTSTSTFPPTTLPTTPSYHPVTSFTTLTPHPSTLSTTPTSHHIISSTASSTQSRTLFTSSNSLPTTSSPVSTSQTSLANDKEDTKVNTLFVIGIVIGVAIPLVGVALIICYVRRRIDVKKKSVEPVNEYEHLDKNRGVDDYQQRVTSYVEPDFQIQPHGRQTAVSSVYEEPPDDFRILQSQRHSVINGDVQGEHHYESLLEMSAAGQQGFRTSMPRSRYTGIGQTFQGTHQNNTESLYDEIPADLVDCNRV